MSARTPLSIGTYTSGSLKEKSTIKKWGRTNMYRYPRPVPPPPIHGPYSLNGHGPYLNHWSSHISSPPAHWPHAAPFHAAMPSYPMPYPKPEPLLPPPRPSFLAQFKNNDGTYDINKMMNTMGQMINTVNQVNGLLKGLLSTFKK
ncbi:hypothetical protein GGQ77_001427 [Geobacillus thermodenitrificans]|nr:hypothetical protein [Geobacillus thermodenitrificans]